jgi:hypothetical protein
MANPRHDVFPAFVAILPAEDPTPLSEMSSAPKRPEGAYQLNAARVIIYNGNVTIALDGSDGPRLVFNEQIDPDSYIKGATVRDDSFVQTISGKKIAYKKDSACGCGSRLKSWNPYRTSYSVKDPTE